MLLSNKYFLPGPVKYFWHGRLEFSVSEDAQLSGPSFLQLKQKLKSSITVFRNAILMSFQKKANTMRLMTRLSDSRGFEHFALVLT